MTVATALMFGVAQIIEGEDTCAYCDEDATLTTWNGADPCPESVCTVHGLQFLDAIRALIVQVFLPRSPREDAPPHTETAA